MGCRRAVCAVPVFATVALATVVFATAALAQPVQHTQPPAPNDGELRVTRVLPDTAGTPRSIITVSFDRPVLAQLGDSAATPPVRFTRTGGIGGHTHDTAPAIRVAWRDPVTLRIVPLAPLAPGATYTVVVDTPLVTYDGARLRRPHVASVRIRDVAVLNTSPELAPNRGVDLPGDGVLKVLMSGAVDSTAWHDRVSLSIAEAPDCTASEIPYRLVEQRLPIASDRLYGFHLQFERGERRELLSRALVYAPVTALPHNCQGTLSLATTDPQPARYAVRTAGAFTLHPGCENDSPCADAGVLQLVFTAPVTRAALLDKARLDPARPIADTALTGGEEGTLWRVAGTFPRGETQHLTIDSGFVDIHGRAYTGPRTMSFRAPHRRPSAAIADDRYVIVPRTAQAHLRVHHVNADSLVVEGVRVPDSTALRFLASDLRRGMSLAGYTPGIVRRIVAVHGALDEERVSAVPLPEEITGSGSYWLMRVRVHWPAPARGDARLPWFQRFLPPGEWPSHQPNPLLVRASNLAIHARVGGSPSAVMVTHGQSGHPVRGARVHLLDVEGRTLAGGSTSDEGVAMLAPDPAGAGAPPRTRSTTRQDPAAEDTWRAIAARMRHVRASLGDDTVWLPLSPAQELGLPAPDAVGAVIPTPLGPGRPSVHRRAIIQTDRGIYRPGDRLYMSFLVRERTDAGLRPPAGDSLRWRVALPYGSTEAIATSTVRLSPFGSAADSMDLPIDGPISHYTVTASLHRAGAWRDVSTQEVRIAEYRVPEFLVDVTRDTSAAHALDTVSFNVRGTYLFQAPMRGAHVRWSASVEDANDRTTALSLPPGFVVGHGNGRWRFPLEGERDFSQFHSGEGTLDEHGALRVTLPAPRGITRAVRVVAAATVTDLTQRTVVASGTIIPRPLSFHLAARISGTEASAGDSIDLSYMTVRTEGQPTPDGDVRIALLRWARDATSQEIQGLTPIDTVWHTNGRTRETMQTVRVPLDTSGVFELVLLSQDHTGRRVRTSMGIRVSPVTSVANASLANAPERKRVDGIAVRVLTDSLRVGDQATIEFDSPFDDAEAWLTVDREGILWQERRRVRAGTTRFRVPVAARFTPNVYVGVTLVARGDPAETRTVAERVRHGYAYVPVDAAPSRLGVHITSDRAEYRPADTARITVRVVDARGKPVRGRVTVWAVDEGVLSLIAYASPDPWAKLFAPWPHATGAFSTMAWL